MEPDVQTLPSNSSNQSGMYVSPGPVPDIWRPYAELHVGYHTHTYMIHVYQCQ